MADKEKLGQMVDALINQNPEEAQVAFHTYLNQRVKEEIRGEPAEAPESTDNTNDE